MQRRRLPVEIKGLQENERVTLLKIIRVLALGCNLDLNNPHKAAESLAELAAREGVAIPSKACLVDLLRA